MQDMLKDRISFAAYHRNFSHLRLRRVAVFSHNLNGRKLEKWEIREHIQLFFFSFDFFMVTSFTQTNVIILQKDQTPMVRSVASCDIVTCFTCQVFGDTMIECSLAEEHFC